jgi:hypothetical protein
MLADFLAAARQRGLDLGAHPGAREIALQVRDLPYRRPTDNEPETLIAEWCGTCSGKHRLLAVLLAELGYATRLMIATYRFRWQGPGEPPAALARVLVDGPVPDVHNFLEVATADRHWQALDVTWPPGAERLGFVVNDDWQPGIRQAVACLEPYTAWPVPPDSDPAVYKAAVVARWCGPERLRREALVAAFAACMGTGPNAVPAPTR